MSLDYGSYLLVSACLDNPYDHKKVETFIESLDRMKVEYLEADFIGIRPDKATYDLSFNEALESITFPKLEIPMLSEHLVSSLEFILDGRIQMRLQVTFLDELSHEVCLVFSHDDLAGETIREEKAVENLKIVEELAFKLFDTTNPLYGIIAVEDSVKGVLHAAQERHPLPVDKAFYHNSLISEEEVWAETIYSSLFVKTLRHGIYIRKTKIGDFSIEGEGDNPRLQRLIRTRLNRMIRSR